MYDNDDNDDNDNDEEKDDDDDSEQENEDSDDENIKSEPWVVGTVLIRGLASRTVHRRGYRLVSHPILRYWRSLNDAIAGSELQFMRLQTTTFAQTQQRQDNT